MAGRTITQRIGLEGGEAIKSQLDAIGAAGQAAFKKISDAVNANGALNAIGPQLDALKSRIEALRGAADGVSDRFEKFNGSLESTGVRIAALSGAVAAAALGFGAFLKKSADSQGELLDSADAIGLTTKELSDMRFAADTVGVSQESLQKGLAKFVGSVNQAGKQGDNYAHALRDLNKEYQTGQITSDQYNKQLQKLRQTAKDNETDFQKLGVRIKDSNGQLRPLSDILDDFKDKFREMDDGVEKTGIALSTFGTRNSKFANFMNMSVDETERLRQEAQRLAPALSRDAAEAVDNFGDALGKTARIADNLRDHVAAVFAPAATRFVDAFNNLLGSQRQRILAAADAIEKRLEPVVGDLIAIMEGRDQDVTNTVFLRIRDTAIAAGKAVVDVAKLVIVAFEGITKAAEPVAAAINSVFGTQFTGTELVFVAGLLRITGIFGLLRNAVLLAVAAVNVLRVAFIAALANPLGIIIALGVAIGFFAVKAIQDAGGVQAAFGKVWDAIKAGGLAVVNAITGAFATVGNFFANLNQAIINGITSIPAVAVSAFNGLVALASAAVQSILQFFANLPANIGALLNAAGGIISNIWDGIVAGAQAVVDNITSVFSQLVTDLGTVFTTVGTTITTAWQAIVTSVAAVIAGITTAAQSVGQSIVDAFNSALNSVLATFTGWRDSVIGFFQSIIDKAKAAGAAITQAFGGGPSSGGGGGDNAQGFATGGHVRGAGTGTSDSIRAWLSNGEFVINARAVAKYGAAFFEMLNGMRLPAGGFDLSGLAASLTTGLAPARTHFATGGLVTAGASGGNTVVLDFGNGQRFSTSASDDTVRGLTKFSAGRQMRSAGRKPTWFQG